MVHVILADDYAFAHARHGAAHLLAAAGQILEVALHGFLDLIVGVQEPENNKQSHHGGDVGIRDFPCSAVVTSMVHLLLDDDDGSSGILRFRH